MRRSRFVFVVMLVAPVVAVALGACAHAPPKPRPPAELTVATAADIKGSWVTSDDLDWSYRLTIAADSTLTATIDRGKMGRCDQHATLAPTGDRVFTLVYDKNTCHTDYVGAQLRFKVGSFTGDALNLSIAGDGVDEKYRYTRAPTQDAP